MKRTARAIGGREPCMIPATARGGRRFSKDTGQGLGGICTHELGGCRAIASMMQLRKAC